MHDDLMAWIKSLPISSKPMNGQCALTEATPTPAIMNDERPQAAAPTRSARGAPWSHRDRAAVVTTAIAQIQGIALTPEQREEIEGCLREEFLDERRQARADCEPE
jgi:hypothetical protein